MADMEAGVARGLGIISLSRRESFLQCTIAGISLGLLMLSCADQAVVGNITKVLWIASVVGLAATNLGLAFPVYFFSVAIFSTLHFASWGSVVERPDNFALAILLLAFLFSHLRRRDLPKIGYLEILMALFITYGLGQSSVLGVMSRSNFAYFMRVFGLPFLMFFLLQGLAASRGQLRIFMGIMMALGIYMAAVSLMERMGLWDYIIPSWVAEVNMASDRSGGLLVQAEFNGLALNLIYCILLGSSYWFQRGHPVLQAVAGSLLLLGVFFTYTRAAWIGTLLASLILLLGGGPSGIWGFLKRISVVVTIFVILGGFIFFPSRIASERSSNINTIYFRLNLWAAGLRMAAQNPIFGYGFGNFGREVGAYQGEMKIGDYTMRLSEEGTIAHNTIVTVLVEHGVLGLILYLFIIGGMVVKAKQGMVSVWPRGRLWVWTFAVAYLVNVQFIYAHEPTTNFIFCGVLGLLSGLNRMEKA